MQFELHHGMPTSAAAELLTLTKPDSSRGLVVLPDGANLTAGGAAALKKFVASGGGLLVFGGPEFQAGSIDAALDELLPVSVEGRNRLMGWPPSRRSRCAIRCGAS